MNNKKKVFLLAALGLLMLAFYQSQQTGSQLQRLQAEGFSVDLTIPSAPLLVVDQRQRQLAAVYADRVVKVRFEQILAVEERFESRNDHHQSMAVRLQLQQHVLPSLTFKAGRPGEAEQWRQELQQRLAANTPR